MTVKLLTEHHLVILSLKEGCTGSSGSTLVKVPHCWVSHVTAHILSEYQESKGPQSDSIPFVRDKARSLTL